MLRIVCFSLALTSLMASIVSAQTGPAWKWKKGQALNYRIAHASQATEWLGSSKTETNTRLTMTQRWQVQDIDSQGVATLQCTLQALSLEVTTPTGEVVLFDSANPEKSTPQLREQMARHLSEPCAVVRVNQRGQIVEVKESRLHPASKFESQSPFGGILPPSGIATGSTWEHSYQVTLEPPHGTGEKFDALQRYRCEQTNGQLCRISMNSELKAIPKAIEDQIPLLQLQPQGEFLFDAEEGVLQSATWGIDKELTGHQGDGSKYRFVSRYSQIRIGK